MLPSFSRDDACPAKGLLQAFALASLAAGYSSSRPPRTVACKARGNPGFPHSSAFVARLPTFTAERGPLPQSICMPPCRSTLAIIACQSAACRFCFSVHSACRRWLSVLILSARLPFLLHSLQFQGLGMCPLDEVRHLAMQTVHLLLIGLTQINDGCVSGLRGVA